MGALALFFKKTGTEKRSEMAFPKMRMPRLIRRDERHSWQVESAMNYVVLKGKSQKSTAAGTPPFTENDRPATPSTEAIKNVSLSRSSCGDGTGRDQLFYFFDVVFGVSYRFKTLHASDDEGLSFGG